jgi:hypothetical protein
VSNKTTIVCSCYLEIKDVNEYEALDEIDKMLKTEYPLSEKTILKIKEVLTMTSEGCGVNYKKEKNGNVRRDNSSESLLKELVA